jgi:hypothetical protein
MVTGRAPLLHPPAATLECLHERGRLRPPSPGAGKAIDIVLEVWAITVAATLAASLAAFFRARHVEHMQRS